MTTQLGDRLVTHGTVSGLAEAVHAHTQYNYFLHVVFLVGLRAV
jgi:hypothetical protein